MESNKKPAKTQENNIKSGAEKIAQEVWDNITPKYLQSLYKSMPQCVQAAVDVKDSDTEF